MFMVMAAFIIPNYTQFHRHRLLLFSILIMFELFVTVSYVQDDNIQKPRKWLTEPAMELYPIIAVAPPRYWHGGPFVGVTLFESLV